jgi:hypothetical protein
LEGKEGPGASGRKDEAERNENGAKTSPVKRQETKHIDEETPGK